MILILVGLLVALGGLALVAATLTTSNLWFAFEAYMGTVIVAVYVIGRKYHLGRRRTPIFLLAQASITVVIVSYLSYTVQIVAYAFTAILSIIMYSRLIAEFRRRKYT